MVHGAGEVLVEDERHAGCIAKAAIGKADSVSLQQGSPNEWTGIGRRAAMTGVQTVAAGPAPLAPRSLGAKRIGHMSVLGQRRTSRLSVALVRFEPEANVS